MENTDKQLKAIEDDIRMTSLYDTEITDVLVEAAKRGGKLMRKMKDDVFIAMLDTINYKAFPDMESYISFLKDKIRNGQKPGDADE